MRKANYSLRGKERKFLLLFAFLFSMTGITHAQLLGQEGFKLVGTGAVGYSPQGSSVAISADGNTAIVGSDQDSLNFGCVFFYSRTGTTWTQQGPKMTANDAVGSPRQGYSVSISDDGNTAVVGGYLDNNPTGAAWVYTRSGGVWTQQGSKLVGTGATTSAIQGWSVAISGDGNTIMSGGQGDDNYKGAVWVFTRSGGVWTQEGSKIVGTGGIGTTVAQGQSVSLSYDGNRAIVGGKNDNGNTGAAWVFSRSGGVWTQEGKLVGTGNVGQSWQGQSVAMSGDGNTAIVGGYLDNSIVGAAWVYVRSGGGTWSQQGSKLVSSDYIGSAQQGYAVSLSSDGNRAIVSGWNDNSAVGCAWIYTRSGGVWTQSGSKMTGGDRAGVGKFGSGVDISADGNTAIFGALYDNSSVGASWIFSACTTAPPKAAITGATAGVICSGYILTVADTSTVGKYISSYSWSDGSTAANSNPITAPGTYSVTITNSCGYTSTESYVITTVNASPVATITGNGYYCSGSSTTLTASDANGTAGPLTYNWSDGSTLATSNPISTAGIYTLTITNGIGCINSASITMATYPIYVSSTGGTGASGVCYPSLKASFDAINNGEHTGDISILVNGNSTETASSVLVESGSGSASYTSISIKPGGGAARSVSFGLSNQVLIDLNGADNVTIDGLNSGGNSLLLSNTSIATSTGTGTIRMYNDASNNKITRCTVLGNSAGSIGTAGAGTIIIGSGVTTGNDNDTISYCIIGSSSTSSLATRHIFAGGTVGMQNDGLVIDRNYISNYFRSTLNSAAIDIISGTSGATISNNKFYQTATRTYTSVNRSNIAIKINNTDGSNFRVLNNTIGYADSSGTGIYTLIFSNTASTTAFVTPIYLNVGSAVASSVQGNTIAGFAISGNSTGIGTSAPFKGIYVLAGLVNIGNLSGNTIGSMTGTGSITYASTGAANDVVGILVNGTNNSVVSNNNIGGITINSANGSARNLYGISLISNSSASLTCNNNTIGGNIANSISNNSLSTLCKTNGITNTGPIGSFTGNTIRNLTVSGGTGTSSSAGLIGIYLGTASNQILTSNNIYNLSSVSTSKVEMVGVYVNTSGNNQVDRNQIYGLSSSSTSGVSLTGIRIDNGTGIYSNNMITIGEGVSTPDTLYLYGINEFAGTNNVRNNSIYVGGSALSGFAVSYCFNSIVTNNTRSVQNNIFYNGRSITGAATGRHYGISMIDVVGLTIDNNLYFAPLSGGVFGRFNGSDVANLSTWKTTVGQDANSIYGNPLYIDPTASTPNLHINAGVVSLVDAAGVDLGISNDYDGQTRASLTPTDIGADAFIVCLTTTSTLTESTYFPYTLNGTTYTTSGTYMQTITNALGCDSTITLNLTVTPVTIAAANCGTTLEYLNTEYIAADPVVGAEQYEFRIIDGAYTATATDDLEAGKVRMVQFAGYTYNTTYQISARVKIGGVWTTYGTACSINTTAFPHSELEAAQCASTLSAMDTYIYTSTVNGATQYRFRVTEGANVQIIDRQVRSFSMPMLASYAYGTTYTIEVAVEFNGSWNPYSTSCTVTTPALPTTQLVSTQCGTNLPAMGTTINANALPAVSAYRFRVTNGASVQTIDKSTPSFKMTELGSYSFSTVYTVDVAAEYNGVWGAYGTFCTITTPAAATIPVTKIQASQCGTTLAAISTYFYATSVSGATQYRFRLTENGNVQVFDNPTRAINMLMLPVRKVNTTYAVEVAVMVGGVWGAYGASCDITTPPIYSKVKAAQCSTTLVKINKVIYADDVSEYATAYRFRVTNGASVQTIERSVNNFMLTQLASSSYNTTYTIDVAVMVNGVWGAYGAACNVTTPGLAGRPMDTDVETELAASAFDAVIFPNPFADEFGVKVSTSNAEMITVTIYDMAGKAILTQDVSPQEMDAFKAGSHFAAGVYQVHVVQGNDVKVLKVVKR